MEEFQTVELHLHLEGSLTPSRLRALAESYGRPDVRRACLDPSGAAYLPVHDFAGFLDRFKAVAAVLRTPRDYHAAARDLGEALAAQGTVYAEVTVGYGVLQRFGRDPVAVQRALAEAASEAAAAGVVLRFQADAVRQWGPDAAWRALEAAGAAGRDLGVVGFGVGGDETAAPASAYAPHLAAARAEGLGTTLHAGETGDAAAVRDALAAGAVRIGHATAAGRDPDTLAVLAAAGAFVELCPGSNERTGAIKAFREHPLRAFLDAGIPCCLNTDDPALFGLTLRGEYERAEAELGLTAAEARRMQRRALAAAFVEDDVREEIGARLAPDAAGE